MAVQVAQAAAGEGAASGGGPGAPIAEEEVRGPHASLAVRLQVCHTPNVCMLAPAQECSTLFMTLLSGASLGLCLSAEVVCWKSNQWRESKGTSCSGRPLPLPSDFHQ